MPHKQWHLPPCRKTPKRQHKATPSQSQTLLCPDIQEIITILQLVHVLFPLVFPKKISPAVSRSPIGTESSAGLAPGSATRTGRGRGGQMASSVLCDQKRYLSVGTNLTLFLRSLSPLSAALPGLELRILAPGAVWPDMDP